jgi:glyoxylate/hydroxypyruvate reductase
MFGTGRQIEPLKTRVHTILSLRRAAAGILRPICKPGAFMTTPQSILFSSDLDDPVAWNAAVQALRPDVTVTDWQDARDPESFRFALLWKPPPQGLSAFTNLLAIQSLGAGVNQLDLSTLPDLPLARLTDPSLTGSMVDYGVAAAMRYFRQLDRYERDSRDRRWDYRQAPLKRDFTIGVMGIGVIGGAAARTFAQLGFPVRGWSRTPREIEGVSTFSGPEGLQPFLSGCNLVLNVLALTEETRGIINRDTLAMMPRGSFVVNIGRGAHVVEDDLADMLDSGHISGATLDVVQSEPLAPEHRLNGRTDVLITPHCAGGIDPVTAAPAVLENMDRALTGRPLLNVVDRTRGY